MFRLGEQVQTQPLQLASFYVPQRPVELWSTLHNSCSYFAATPSAPHGAKNSRDVPRNAAASSTTSYNSPAPFILQTQVAIVSLNEATACVLDRANRSPFAHLLASVFPPALVVDTNVWMHDLSIVQDLASTNFFSIIIPKMVHDELVRHSQRPCGNKAELANEALEYIYSDETRGWLYIQSQVESVEHGGAAPGASTTPDDLIFSASLWWKKHTEVAPAVVTGDKNMHLKSSGNSIWALEAIDLFRRVEYHTQAQGWSIASTTKGFTHSESKDHREARNESRRNRRNRNSRR